MDKIRVKQMNSPRSGRPVANQFIIEDGDVEYFQSYDTIIVKREYGNDSNRWQGRTTLDENYWDYSRTTAKYRNEYLGETTAETERRRDRWI